MWKVTSYMYQHVGLTLSHLWWNSAWYFNPPKQNVNLRHCMPMHTGKTFWLMQTTVAIFTVCKASPLGFRFPLFFIPHPQLEILAPLFGTVNFCTLSVPNFKNHCLLYRYHCNTLPFEEIYADLSPKSPQLCPFLSLNSTLKVGFPPFILKNFYPPFWFL